jgi:lysophospholipase L1-like esterase
MVTVRRLSWMFDPNGDKEVDSMRRTIVATLALLSTLIVAPPTLAGPMTYLSIGDSVAFGETDFTRNPSNGDRGFVSNYASYLASQNGGVGPNVVNLAIDGETSHSFLTGSGRVISIPGMNDQSVAAWNTNYSADPTVPQNAKFLQAISAAKAAGGDVGAVTVSLGANDLFQLAASPSFLSASADIQKIMLNQTLSTIATNYAIILAEARALLPNAKISILGEYNPFPASPNNPLNALAGPAIQGLNSAIQLTAKAFSAQYVDTYTPFVGHEADYTYMSPTSGNVHPNALGYSVIAAQIEAVPEPSTLAVMGLGFAALAVHVRRRRSRLAA